MSETQQCEHCNQVLPLEDFYIDVKGDKSYPHKLCRDCEWSRRKVRHASQPDLVASRRVAANKWYHANNDKDLRSKRRKDVSRRFAVLKAVFYEVFGETCVRCGFSDKRALQIDHVNGDSRADRERFGTYGSSYIRHVIKSGRRHYQLLCSNCNWIKRHEEGNHAVPLVVLQNPRLDALYNKYKRELVTGEHS